MDPCRALAAVLGGSVAYQSLLVLAAKQWAAVRLSLAFSAGISKNNNDCQTLSSLRLCELLKLCDRALQYATAVVDCCGLSLTRFQEATHILGRELVESGARPTLTFAVASAADVLFVADGCEIDWRCPVSHWFAAICWRGSYWLLVLDDSDSAGWYFRECRERLRATMKVWPATV